MRDRGRTPDQKRDIEMESLAAQIPNQVVLEAALQQIEDEHMRRAVRERIRPYLSFDLLSKVEMHLALEAVKPRQPVDLSEFIVEPSRLHLQDVTAQCGDMGFEPLVLPEPHIAPEPEPIIDMEQPCPQ